MSATKRRADLTFSHNRGHGRHGWLRLTPAYSVRIVRGLLDDGDARLRVLDPFSGTGTTVLCASERGCPAVGVELNPFLVWFGGIKLQEFRPASLRQVPRLCDEVLRRNAPPVTAPPIHNIHRWWNADVLQWLCEIAGAIDAKRSCAAKDLLTVAFLRTMMDLSGAAFNHVSMSFKAPKAADDATGAATFRANVHAILEGAQTQPAKVGEVRQGDARNLKALGRRTFHRVITSPPYPNRMSYIRELRPYMYWTRHLIEARQAGELDWQAIGGTWGIATSRLRDWKRTSGATPKRLAKLLPRIAKAHEKNGPLLASYLDRYFEDTESHLGALRKRVCKGGSIHYIVGNSSFYGELVPVELLYAELMERAGFRNAEVIRIRKRNSKKELYEFEVRAKA
ncbi:MAG: DNA methyltransferase [Myxococcota bacterium]